MDNILDFHEANGLGIEAVGGKGLNLSKMTANGIAVPSGFILLSSVYETFMKENKIDIFVEKQISAIQETNMDLVLKSIRETIIQAKFTPDMEQKIKERFDGFAKPIHLAVRSSATAEDLEDASFAGQQESFLNVTTYENLLYRIKCCFASLWSKRAFAYREAKQYDHQKVSIAVVVQKMVCAERSGVMFTANPVSGEKEIVIDASYGLGEAVVSGQVTPDHCILHSNGDIKSYQIGSKEIQIVYADDETKKIDTEETERKKRCLDDKDLQALWKQAETISNLYHDAMDIEWAKEDNQIYILQARKITTIHQETKNPKPKTVYHFGKNEKKYLNNMIEHFPVLWYPLDDAVAMILQNMKYDLLQEAGIYINNPLHMNTYGVIEAGTVKTKLGIKVLRYPKLYQEYKNNAQNIQLGTKDLKACETQVKSIEKQILTYGETTTSKELWKTIQQLIAIHKKIAYVRFRYLMFPAVLVGETLDKFVKKIDKTYTEYDLLSKLEYMTVTINKELEKLSKKIQENQDLVQVMQNDITIHELKIQYPDMYDLVHTFMEQYGWKSNYCCIPFSGESWNENISRLLHLLLVTNAGTEQESNQKSKYDSIMAYIQSHCKGKKQQKLYDDIAFYRNAHVLREESQYLWETVFGLLRCVVKIFCLQIHMPYEDILYLKIDELQRLILQEEQADTPHIIQSRKAKRKEAEAEWENMMIAAFANENHDTFQGVSGSSGKVKGSVCIVKNHTEFQKIQKGDILVCPYTDPEWTPLFQVAKAVVADTGGALSHAAIVAREYGIPAVLGVGNATMQLKDGDMIIVDGDKGLVEKVM